MEFGSYVLLADLLKIFFLVTAPVVFLVGIFLLYDVNIYLRIEQFLSRSYGPFKNKLANKLEKNREALQLFLLERRRMIGIICLLNSLFAIFVSSALLKK